MSRDAIEELTHRYADAVVRRDADRWAETWAVDARWNLGRDRFVEGRDAILELWLSAMGGFEAVVQNVLNSEVDLDEVAGTGTGRCYIQEAYRRTDGTPGILLAHYDDTYVRTDDGWRFASRELVVHYGGPPDLSAPFANTAAAT